MKVVLHDRTDGLGQEVREGAQRKLTRLERHFGKVLEAEVEFSEKRRSSDLSWYVCTIHLRLDGHRAPVLHAKEQGADPLTALDIALDKLDRQVVAFKEKVTRRRQSTSPVRVPVEPEAGPPAHSSEPERLRLKVRPMSIEEASSELLADSQPFLVYLDEDSGDLRIMVKRADGGLAVIEPVVP
ncbi:MAG TPA: ribosome-associated translation inhibitor RaiA [Candidatus Dormibacteraeota bacterium]|nr:ribosome-associated translation inhibitor RaiA [Candidatus Dormibacteraeota bacterium]